MKKQNAVIKLKSKEIIEITDAEEINYNMFSRQYYVRGTNNKILFICDSSVVEYCGLNEYEVPANGWIPIDEKRPAPEEEVLVCNVHGVIFIGERADYLGKNIFVDSAKTFSTKAAAWMPLPEKYEGAVDNG